MNLLLIYAFLTLVIFERIQCQEVKWNYQGSSSRFLIGQLKWKDTFPECGGIRQSPINIVTSQVEADSSIDALQFAGFVDSNSKMFKLENTGLSAKLTIEDPSISFQGGGLTGQYKVSDAHFHWGEGPDGGSEHSIDGKKYAAEMHIVGYNSKFPSLEDALDKSDGLAVLGVFLEASGDTDNQKYKPIFDEFASVSFADQTKDISGVNLEDLLPSTKTFYRYQGSLTTPPCYQSVTWTVFAETVKISRQQFRSLKGMYETKITVSPRRRSKLVDNCRVEQALNGRTVTKSGGKKKKRSI